MRARRLVLLAFLLVCGWPAAAGAERIGTVAVRPCRDDHAFWCGSIRRPLDRRHRESRSIPIAFRWRPATGGRSHGPTLVAVEGGPGYPSTGSSVEYTGIYGPLLRTRDLLLVDQRGTGGSHAIDCPGVQRFTGPTWDVAYAGRVARCARRIDRDLGVPGAHRMFGTADATDDLAAVLRRLRLGRVDLYGDSYGTWFAQAFMSRHARQLRSVVLDSAYPVRGLDPFYASTGATFRDAFDAVCARSGGCAGSALERLGRLVARLRTSPLRGRTRLAGGGRTRARITVRSLVDMVQDAGSDPVVYRELDPAVRAALAGDDVPLLRLAAQSGEWDHGRSPVPYFSDGLYFAVACTDYPQLFDLAAPPAARGAQLARSIADGPREAFAPFTLPEWLQLSAGSETYRACLRWPRVHHVRPPMRPGFTRLPASVPLLVVGGDLDSLTPLRDARRLAPALARRSRVVTLRNTVHVTSEGDDLLSVGAGCGRRIIRAFVRRPFRLERIDASCARRIPPVRIAAYPRRLADARPARLIDGDGESRVVRRAATVAVGALGDAIVHRFYGGTEHGPGLRGGRYTARGDGPVRFRLLRVRYTADTAVSGHGTWRPAGHAVSGFLRVRLPGGRRVGLRIDHWVPRRRWVELTHPGHGAVAPLSPFAP